MLEIQTKHVQPDIVVLELTENHQSAGTAKHGMARFANLVKEGPEKVFFDLAAVDQRRQQGMGSWDVARQMKKPAASLRLGRHIGHVEQS